jgi:hypothetical protein
MTLSIAWIREHAGTSELVFASDSRLTGGGHIDCCQKIFRLPREDCGISFCGHTFLAYPFILQVESFISEYKKGYDRATDISDMQLRIAGIFNSLIESYKDPVAESFAQDLKETQFLFGGWSWKHSKFFIYKLLFQKPLNRFHFAGTGVWKRYQLPRTNPLKFAFIGDYPREFLFRIDKKIHERGILKTGKLNYEPLEVLTEMLTDEKFTKRLDSSTGLIGGAPQVMIVYPYIRTVNFGVYWNVDNRRVLTSRGRILNDFEATTMPTIDPRTLLTTLPAEP